MIDILMAVYNGEKYLTQQLDSILNQSFADWTLFIRDDGSSDGTPSIVDKYVSLYPGKIVKLTSANGAGGSKYNFYELLKNSSADYIMFADQDDVWEKDKVKEAYNRIIEEEKRIGSGKPVLCHSDLRVADGELNIVSDSMFKMQKLDSGKNGLNDYLVQNNVTGCTVIINKTLKEMCRNMPKEAIMHDWWLALIAAAFGKVCYIEKTYILYRQHGNNVVGSKNLKSPIYLLKKLFNRAEVKETLEKTYAQAKAFLSEYETELSSEQKDIVEAYISLKKPGKLKKYAVIKKYGFMKSGLARKLGYLLFI